MANGTFQSTPSGGKATSQAPHATAHSAVSIHAFRGEGDRLMPRTCTAGVRFNPRLPGGRRPGKTEARSSDNGFQSTPSGGKATWRVVLDPVQE